MHFSITCMKDYFSVDEYDYLLPEKKIAHFPLPERDASKLLVYDKGTIIDSRFSQLSQYLPNNSLLLFNNTKVIPARVLAKNHTGATIEIFCLEPLHPADYAASFSRRDRCEWKCLIGNLKRWRNDHICIPIQGTPGDMLIAKKKERNNKFCNIEFSWNNDELSFSEIIDRCGHVPLPPYIKRDDKPDDKERYQTVYARHNGSVAAPTAGLHFTNKLMEELRQNNIQTEELTLHVGAGTFLPLKSSSVADHEMHIEHFSFSLALVEKMLHDDKYIIPVGTTSLRALESIYWIGTSLASGQCDNPFFVSQWQAYNNNTDISKKEALYALSVHMRKKNTEHMQASTKILIMSGYHCRLARALITNFHQPRSTLLMLVAALIGDDWKHIYKHALKNDYRFLSYGDSSLLLFD